MKEVSFVYDSEENGWVSEEIELLTPVVLLIALKERGIVVVKKLMEEGVEPRDWSQGTVVYVKEKVDGGELEVRPSDTSLCTQVVRLYMSVEPKYIKYADI